MIAFVPSIILPYLLCVLIPPCLLVVKEARGSADNAEWTDLYDLEGPRSTDVSPPNESYGFPQAQGTKDERDNMDEKQDLKNRDVVKVLPFEFIALEACLEAACSSLDNEVLLNHLFLFLFWGWKKSILLR